uniref:ABSCISIC ACID-INSENSITIVE 5-like protein 3 n=1 Tax=Noccaea caerulescens TaxID=107243 RepID=A0A1J3FWC7_NOCCA
MGSLRGNVEAEPISQSLARQGSSLYSLKLHEVQTHLGSSGKPLGSMNLDELLKSVWSAEANQPPQATEEGVTRQGSLTLPRDLSKKTVDEVWRDIQQDKYGSSTTNPHDQRRDDNNSNKQPTLGEITLEDLLMKAGVVTETLVQGSNHGRDGGGLGQNVAQTGQWIQYHQLPPIPPQPQHHQHQGFMPYPVCEMQEMVSPTSLMMAGLSDAPQAHGRKRVASSGGEIVEKTVERRQKRMIKNRESAARSRARKQAYTNELEIKVSKLEEENEKLRRLQEVEKILPSEPPPDPKWKLRRTSSTTF